MRNKTSFNLQSIGKYHSIKGRITLPSMVPDAISKISLYDTLYFVYCTSRFTHYDNFLLLFLYVSKIIMRESKSTRQNNTKESVIY